MIKMLVLPILVTLNLVVFSPPLFVKMMMDVLRTDVIVKPDVHMMLFLVMMKTPVPTILVILKPHTLAVPMNRKIVMIMTPVPMIVVTVLTVVNILMLIVMTTMLVQTIVVIR
jgi:hypothetical protein